MKLLNLRTIFVAAAALLSTGATVAQARPTPLDPRADRPAIVLVHGAWETAGSWALVRQRLLAHGYRVIAVNLPGRPGAPAAASAVTLDMYRNTVLEAIRDERRPVVLVGHSFGGLTISNVAETAPERVKTLVYLAALLPRDGDSLLALAQGDAGSVAAHHIQIDEPAGLARIDATKSGALFANDGSAAQQQAVSASMVDEPLGPMTSRIHLTAERFGASDRVYIKTLRDQAVSAAYQDTMIARGKIRLTIALDTGHSPFATASKELAAAIEQAAN